MKYAFIQAQERHSVALLCEVLGVSEQGYYQWRSRPESNHQRRDKELSAKIYELFGQKKQRYGSPRLHRELRAHGEICSRKRVARLMREQGLRAKGAHKFRATTNSHHNKPVAPNLLKRHFATPAPNQVWVSDITYLWTDEGWLYLAVFIDLYSRAVVGWQTAKRMDTSLTLSALERACARRRPERGLIIHSDRGTQYASETFRQALKKRGMVQSMSRKANCWDNSVAESFFRSLKVEAIYGEKFGTRRKMEYELFDYIEYFYNKERRHSTNQYLAPFQKEQRYSIVGNMAA